MIIVPHVERSRCDSLSSDPPHPPHFPQHRALRSRCHLALMCTNLPEDLLHFQVPDITGTEYIDPMTTSMDGIEELPTNEEAQVPLLPNH